MAFPIISSLTGFKRVAMKSANRKTAGGYTMGFPTGSIKKYRFELSYTVVSNSDVSTMDTFFNDNQGGSFQYTDPISDSSYSVEFDQDEIEFERDIKLPGRWKFNISLVEV